MRALPRLRDLPTLLSLSRLLFAASFVVVDGALVRASLVGAAGLTDLLDGWLARRWNVVSRLGALLDPIGDHVFALVATATLVVGGALSLPWAVVLLSRDIATAAGFLIAIAIPRLRHEEFQARWAGKVVTVLQFLTLLAIILVPAAAVPLLILVAVFSAASIVDYAAAAWRNRA